MSAFGIDVSTGAFFDVVTDFDSRVLYHSRTGNKLDKPIGFQITGCRHRRSPMSIWQSVYKGKGFIDERTEFFEGSWHYSDELLHNDKSIHKTITIWT